MAGKFTYKKFSEIDLDNPFFDSLKKDYPGTETSTEFCKWFRKKAEAGLNALIYESENGIGAFLFIKQENEAISLVDAPDLPACNRLKLGTIKISDLHKGQRIGEGAIGIALWNWQRSKVEEIYVTVFPKHEILIGLLERFGFVESGTNPNGEKVYIKSRCFVRYDNPYVSFPFVNPDFKEAGYLIFEDGYHDTMFPFSELRNVKQKSVELDVANGISKIYVSAQAQISQNIGDPVLIYRKYNGTGSKKYKSCVTSFGMIVNAIQVKERGRVLISFEDLIKKIGNKSVFDQGQLRKWFDTNNNMIVYEFLYYAYFGAGHNINYAWLNDHNLWSKNGDYPSNTKLSPNEFKAILKEGNLDVQNIIID